MSTSPAHALDALLRPRSIAVIGASAKGNRGSRILRNLRRFGYAGQAFAINPNYAEVEGYPCHPSLDDLPVVPEFVAVAVPAERAVDGIRSAARVGSRAGLIIGGGFGEGAGRGADLAREIAALCNGSGLRLCGPNCYGILNVAERVAAFSGNVVDPLLPGPVGFVLQSGAISHATHDTALGRGLGVSAIITSGNELNCELSEYVDFLVQDEQTRVVAVFIEGLKKPAAFAAAARRALEAGKPVVALKVGRSERGQRSTLAHTGSVAGADEAYDGLFASAGVIRVHDIEEYIETLLLMSARRRPSTPSVALASISGGLTTLISDIAEEVGIELPAVGDGTRRALEAALPDFGVPSNPLDTTGLLAERPEILPQVTQAFLDDPAISSFGLLFNTPRGCEPQRKLYLSHAAALQQAQSLTDKPLFGLAVVSGRVDEDVTAILAQQEVPFLSGARAGLEAVRHWAGYATRRAKLLARATATPLRLGRSPLTGGQIHSERASMNLLELYGIRFPRRERAVNAEEAASRATEIGFPVVLKVDSPDIPHKTEVQGVRLGLRNAAEVSLAFDEVMASARRHSPAARIEGVTLQEMVRGGVEILLGVVRDPQFGPQLAVAPGGVFVELLRSAQVRQLPVSRAEAEEMLSVSVLRKLLSGYRGAPAADVDALLDMIEALSSAALEFGPAVSEIDLNPVLVLERGKGALALDALIVTKD